MATRAFSQPLIILIIFPLAEMGIKYGLEDYRQTWD